MLLWRLLIIMGWVSNWSASSGSSSLIINEMPSLFKTARISGADGQGFEAFQTAQLRGIKSRLVYLPEENHWVLSAQNGLVWQREFFRWLR